MLPASNDELQSIITTKHPSVADFAGRLVGVFDTLRNSDLNKESSARKLSPRDLLKWAGRIGCMESFTLERIFVEACDCFCMMHRSDARRDKAVSSNAWLGTLSVATALDVRWSSTKGAPFQAPLQQKHLKIVACYAARLQLP